MSSMTILIIIIIIKHILLQNTEYDNNQIRFFFIKVPISK